MCKDKGILKAIWAGMFILCGVLGFLPPQTGANRILLMALAALFFLPPALDLYYSYRRQDKMELRLLRNLSLLSLCLTLVLLVANVLSVLGSEALGNALYYLLLVVSTPMVCGQFWAYSLFLWALVLWCSIAALYSIRKAEKSSEIKNGKSKGKKQGKKK